MFFPNPSLTGALQAFLQGPVFRQRKAHISPDHATRVLRYGAPLGNIIELHESLPRCMGRLKEKINISHRADNTLPSGTVVIAKHLQSGCGRFDREWYAPKGGFWMSVAWADTLLPEFSRFLPFAAGIACCESVRAFGVKAAIKWVNDVHVQGRKIAGVLCETVNGGYMEDRYHLIGVGINCNNTTFPQELQESATSMRQEIGKGINLESFTVELLANLAWNFGLVHLCEEQSLAWQRDGRKGTFVNPVVEEWKRLSDTMGQKVIYGYDVVKNPMYQATVQDVDQDGGLVMLLESGEIVTENSGEVVYLDNQQSL